MRTAVILTLLWVVVAGPALCLAGILAHPCGCGASLGCSHEVDCAGDPCSELARCVNAPTGNAAVASGVLPSSPAPSSALAGAIADPLAPGASRPMRHRLPFPESDLPILS